MNRHCLTRSGHTSVSINVVTRNREVPLKKAIQSALDQTRSPDEIVVVDNASTDKTVSMLEADFPSVRVVRMHRNIGCQPGRNIGMANCASDIIFNLDDDGILAPNAIEQALTIFQSHPEVGLIAASVRVPPEKESQYANHNSNLHCHYTASFIGAGHALRRSLLHAAGYFPEYVRGHSEADLGLRILDRGWEMLYAPQVVLYHDIVESDDNRAYDAYYRMLHQLETPARLQPATVACSQIAWRLIVGLGRAVKTNTLPSYSWAVAWFLCSLPRIWSQRTPVSLYTSRKFQYLSHHEVHQLHELGNLSTQGLLGMAIVRIRSSWKCWGKRSAPSQ